MPVSAARGVRLLLHIFGRRLICGQLAIALSLAGTLLAPNIAAANASAKTAVQLAHSSLLPGQYQTITVRARDLGGKPLSGASVSAEVRYTSRLQSLRLPRTDADGVSSLQFLAPKGTIAGAARVVATITNGYLKISALGHFLLVTSPRPAPPGTLVLLSSVLPPAVIAPAPVWIVAYATSKSGTPATGATVSAVAHFREGIVRVWGSADDTGAATIQVPTNRVKTDQSVRVLLTISWQQQRAVGSATLEVRKPLTQPGAGATPTSTSTPVPTLTPTPTPTATPVPAPVPTPTPVPTVGLFAPPQPTVTPTPTPTPTQTTTNGATTTPTSTPVPTATPTPTATASPTPGPTLTPTPTPPCPGTYNGHDGCIDVMLNIINNDRAMHKEGPLQLNLTQSTGTGSCVGSYGHSTAMAQSGYLWHQNSDYPKASWPADICIPYSTTGENVGQYSSGNEKQDLVNINAMMMNEPYVPGCSGTHVCNILSSDFGEVGIGVFNQNGTTWLTEDFIG